MEQKILSELNANHGIKTRQEHQKALCLCLFAAS
jgi:hypothetical protein